MNIRYLKHNTVPGFLLVCLLCWVPAVWGQTLSSDPASVQFRQRVDTLLEQTCNHGSHVGMKFVSLDRQDLLYSKNSDQPFLPASNMKVLTSIMALKKVGPDYRFYTRLYTDGNIDRGTLRGNLYIKGFGDPNLVTEQMWILVNELKNVPIHKIEGNIIADNSFFAGQGRLKTWRHYKGTEAYLAPLGALSFNFNTITVHVQPGKKVGDPPLVLVDPETAYIRVTNSATTTPGRRGKRRLVVNRLERNGYDEIVVSGSVPRFVARKKYYLNITDPQWYTVNVFKEFLERAGVEVVGNLQRGKLPRGARMLVQHESPPLAEILRGLNKFSNNFMAEQILQTLAAEYVGPPGDTKNGVRFIYDYLLQLGFEPDEFRVVDGSGLSRANRLTPDQLVAVLEDAYKDLSVFPEFISALGVMGVDGSVEERMNGNRDAQKIRVKTGTLNHVSALSGYFQAGDGERFAFSMLLNDLKCSNGKAMKLEDKILEMALKFERNLEKTASGN